MDFDLLDLREAAGKEYWVHLRAGDRLLFADMDKQERPCRVKVASVANPEVEQALKAVTRAGRMYRGLEAALADANRQQRAALEKRLGDVERESERALTSFLMKSIVGWENIEKGGKDLPFSREALADMAEPKAPLFRLAQAIAEDAASAQDPFAESAPAS
jgi:hypothetical protein